MMAWETGTGAPGQAGSGQQQPEAAGAPQQTPPQVPPGNQGRSQEWSKRDMIAYSQRRKSPTWAGLLSIMPGLGQVYVGYYQRGFIHVLIVFSTIALLASETMPGFEPLLGPFLSFFWLYNIIDAVRLASFYNEALAGASPEEIRKQIHPPGLGGSLFGGVFLVILGFLMFLHTMFDVPLDWLENWWPILPIGLGVYLIYKGIQDRRESTGP